MSYQPQYILRPVSPLFIVFSLVAAFALNILPWGQSLLAPDFVALVLVFWNIHHPRKVGIGVAFMMGLLMDVNEASLMGEHALAYTLLSYGAIMLHRRVLWFPLLTQALHVLPLILLAQLVTLLVRLAVGAQFPGVLFFGESVATAMLWPVASWLLLAPQRRPRDRDETRPI
jgi:rod shape-determining protein MreD